MQPLLTALCHRTPVSLPVIIFQSKLVFLDVRLSKINFTQKAVPLRGVPSIKMRALEGCLARPRPTASRTRPQPPQTRPRPPWTRPHPTWTCPALRGHAHTSPGHAHAVPRHAPQHRPLLSCGHPVNSWQSPGSTGCPLASSVPTAWAGPSAISTSNAPPGAAASSPPAPARLFHSASSSLPQTPPGSPTTSRVPALHAVPTESGCRG